MKRRKRTGLNQRVSLDGATGVSQGAAYASGETEGGGGVGIHVSPTRGRRVTVRKKLTPGEQSGTAAGLARQYAPR